MKLNPRFFDYVRMLKPDVSFRDDVIVSMDGDEVLSIIWNLPGLPPTDDEIAKANPPPYVPPPTLQQQFDDLQNTLLANNIITQTQLQSNLSAQGKVV